MDDLIDQSYLANQVDLLGVAEMAALTRIFQQASRTMMRGLDQAVAGQDRKAVRDLAHSMRSASGPLGLIGLATCAGRLEHDAQTASHSDLCLMVNLLHRARRQSLEALAQLRRTGLSPYLGSMETPSR